MDELSDASSMSMNGIRRSGGGRKSALESMEGLDAAFLKVLSQHTAGSPMDETIKWTNLSRHEIADLLKADGVEVSVTVVDQLLKRHNYRKRKAQKRLSTDEHPSRNDQFENIERLIETYKDSGNPVISMDTKKKN
jgi:Rhodopirellula transposase DDE domain